MKYILLTLLASLSFNALAGITTCHGLKDGREITFTLDADEAGLVSSLSVSVDGSLVSKKLTEIRTNEIAGGVMITASEPWAIAINDVSVFVDEKRNCFDGGKSGCYLGWVNLFKQNLVISGIPLICE